MDPRIQKMETEEMSTQLKPSVFIAMPCYDSVKIQTMVSMCKLVADLTKAGLKIDINTLKSPYISYARNILTAQFMASDKDYLLFIDADVEFEPECPLRMVVANKDIVCTPYRVKTEKVKYTTTVPDNDNVKVLVAQLLAAEH